MIYTIIAYGGGLITGFVIGTCVMLYIWMLRDKENGHL